MQRFVKFSKEKVELVKDAFSLPPAKFGGGINSLESVIINKGGRLYEIPFQEKNVYEVQGEPTGQGVSIFLSYIEADSQPQKFSWYQYHKGVVLRTGLRANRRLGAYPLVFHHKHLFTQDILLYIDDCKNQTCPVEGCSSKKVRPTELLVKRENELLQISERKGVYGEEFNLPYKKDLSGVAFCFKGACEHSWYNVIQFDRKTSKLYRSFYIFDYQKREEIEHQVIWKKAER